MNGSLVSRTVVLLLVGVLGLAIGVGPANATLIDDFNTDEQSHAIGGVYDAIALAAGDQLLSAILLHPPQ